MCAITSNPFLLNYKPITLVQGVEIRTRLKCGPFATLWNNLSLIAGILNLISRRCAVAWKTTLFLSQSELLFSCRLGNHAFRKPITVVVSFDEPINDLGQILSQFDDVERNFSSLATRGPFLAFYFGFQGYLFFNVPLEPIAAAKEMLVVRHSLSPIQVLQIFRSVRISLRWFFWNPFSFRKALLADHLLLEHHPWRPNSGQSRCTICSSTNCLPLASHPDYLHLFNIGNSEIMWDLARVPENVDKRKLSAPSIRKTSSMILRFSLTTS